MNRTLLSALAVGCSLATIRVATAGSASYSTVQVINEGDSDSVFRW